VEETCAKGNSIIFSVDYRAEYLKEDFGEIKGSDIGIKAPQVNRAAPLIFKSAPFGASTQLNQPSG
jgi:hypothetical protein